MAKLKIISLLMILSIISIGIFSAFRIGSEKSITYTLNDSKRSFSLDITWDENGNTSISKKDQKSIVRYLKQVFSNQNFETIAYEEVTLYINEEEEENIDKEIVTLIAKGTNSQALNIPIAVSFVSNTQLTLGGSLSLGDIHSCTGNPCSCCKFKKRTFTTLLGSGSYIIGCECLQSEECSTVNGQCNHTRTTN